MKNSKKILILFFLLVSCKQKNTTTACLLYKNDSYLKVEISAVFDEITNIKIKEDHEIPYKIIKNININDDFILEDNHLYKEYEITLDDKYSLEKTIEEFKVAGLRVK